ncbi:MAG: calcium/sodium antiporter [Desulfobacterales bacterium]|nr:calcium/sodium antiporter [Desulfobacterales bacterium]MDD4070997.1 calcium/sodium antiporter [Desulfobacterales bacterium]MDD4391910.1 calcium/sodium antiporter [Desulfobacterales bacterium]
MTQHVVLFVVGLFMLYYGAEWLVKGSSGLSRSLGLSPLVIGLTVVAFGTSAPELVVSLVSSIKGKSMIAVGNVVGSNICNIALVLGLSSMVQPIRAHRSVIRRDIPVMLGISLYLLLISINGMIGRVEGATLFAGIIVYTVLNYRSAAEGGAAGRVEDAPGDADGHRMVAGSRLKQSGLVVAGITGVVVGADFLVDSSVAIMKVFGFSEKFIGLTVVALGTSLPELATSVIAAVRKEMDISIGNLVGSNVFNILGVLGTASLVRPIQISGGFFGSGLFIDYLVMMATSFLPWLMMRKTLTVTRKDGLVLISIYAAYVAWLLFKS